MSTSSPSLPFAAAPAAGPAMFIVFLDEVDNKIKVRNIESGQIYYSGTDAASVIQKALDALPTYGGIVLIRNGVYTISSSDIFIPNIHNLTIQGESPSGNTILDARKIDLPGQPILGRSSEDRRHTLQQINRLTLRNLYIIGNQTVPGYLADHIAMTGIRADNVNNPTIENIYTNNVGTSVICTNVNAGIIRNCYSWNDAAGPALLNNSKSMTVENCYTFASLDDSFACLGTARNILFRDCTADKGVGGSSVTASCFKLDSGGKADSISSVKYITCNAYNAKPGRTDIQGGFINGDTTTSDIKYVNCSAINCNVGIKVAGTNMRVMECVVQNCHTGIATDVNSPGAQFIDISFIVNKSDTDFYTPPVILRKR